MWIMDKGIIYILKFLPTLNLQIVTPTGFKIIPNDIFPSNLPFRFLPKYDLTHIPGRKRCSQWNSKHAELTFVDRYLIIAHLCSSEKFTFEFFELTSKWPKVQWNRPSSGLDVVQWSKVQWPLTFKCSGQGRIFLKRFQEISQNGSVNR